VAGNRTERFEIRLAQPGDVYRIAGMSRYLIEHDLEWRWTPRRILGYVRDREANVIVICDQNQPIGFGLMKYRDEEAHLLLLAVSPAHQRRGAGAALVLWLEQTALTAGIGCIYLETRCLNTGARRFYRRLGYREIRTVRGYYQGVEDAVLIAKDLWDLPIACK
jgi:ribosomal-protein-alanine N-acetyltransferase